MQISRTTGLSYKSALFMMHRIRYAMADPAPRTKLQGTVEVDETYAGGEPRIRGSGKPGRGTAKTPVVGLVERGGDVRARVISDVSAKTLKGAIREHVDRKSRVITDDFASYDGVGKEFAGGHDTINHSAGEYSRGDIYTNTAESFFALIKRGMYGVFHAISKRHLHRYVSEFELRWTTRKLDDGARTVQAIRQSQGKRLMYRDPARN